MQPTIRKFFKKVSEVPADNVSEDTLSTVSKEQGTTAVSIQPQNEKEHGADQCMRQSSTRAKFQRNPLSKPLSLRKTENMTIRYQSLPQSKIASMKPEARKKPFRTSPNIKSVGYKIEKGKQCNASPQKDEVKQACTKLLPGNRGVLPKTTNPLDVIEADHQMSSSPELLESYNNIMDISPSDYETNDSNCETKAGEGDKSTKLRHSGLEVFSHPTFSPRKPTPPSLSSLISPSEKKSEIPSGIPALVHSDLGVMTSPSPQKKRTAKRALFPCNSDDQSTIVDGATCTTTEYSFRDHSLLSHSVEASFGAISATYGPNVNRYLVLEVVTQTCTEIDDNGRLVYTI